KGVGEKRGKALENLGIITIWNLLTYFPFRYEDLTVKDIEKIEDRQKVVLEGTVIAPPHVQYYGRKKSRLSFRIKIDYAIIPITFFNQPYLAKQIEEGKKIKVFGNWDMRRKQLSGIKIIGRSSVNKNEKFEPIYHSSKDISHNIIRKLVRQSWDLYHHKIEEILPNDLIKKYRLLSAKEAIFNMHFPETEEIMDTARETIVFTEFLIFQTQAQYRKNLHKNIGQGRSVNYQLDYLKYFFSSLPFELTKAQKKAVNDISADMKRPIQMYRLLQGDVGSGKTVVAAGGIVAAQSANLQSAFMAPTEILAEQHYISLKKFYQSFNLKVELLTGSTKTKKRREIIADLKEGKIDLLIGTHALIQEDVIFKDLALIIIDEQHRFGVNQRRQLREKGKSPDVLFMTATPIPRTLSITAFGEMDVTVIDELPPGRLPVETHWIKRESISSLMGELLKELENESQVYVISPLIEESDSMDLENAKELFEEYTEIFSPNYKVALLHGQMTSEEKEQVMSDFKEHQIDILVSTTVIEVGVDVPNATRMIIHNADRFGLAQLHQLRGRVGRGEKQSECILIANPKSESGVERMKIMTKTTDGFKISQKDLEMRGPGEFFGKKQSGLPEFKVADIVEDGLVLEAARYEAANILKRSPELKKKSYERLRTLVGIEDGKISDILD
ncbi:MAG: ATP-dependent DNA helicase RecG, partial [Atopostipes sp.]|nr:ATP-dependent DNA helicase RecG [Atopostipes sp.]